MRLLPFLLLSIFCATALAGISPPFQMLTNARNVIVWQEFHPWLMITEDVSSGRTCYYLDHTNLRKMTLKPPDPGSWIPLGSAIKWLMFAKYYQGRDRLMAHDVDINVDYIAWPSMQRQVGCGMTGTKCVFGQYRASMVGDHYPVDLYDYNVQSGLATLAVASDSEKSQFAHDGSLIVYRAYFGPGNVGIYGRYFHSTTEFEVAAGNGLAPTVCGSLVAWAEVNGSGYNILAKDISTGETRVIAYTTADPPRPQVGRGSIFWQQSNPSTGLDVWGYDWESRQVFPVITAPSDQFRLRVCDDLVTWVTGTTYQTLWGATIGDYVSFTGAVTGITSGGAFYCQIPLHASPGVVGAVKVTPKSGQPAVSIGQKVTVNGRSTQDPQYFGRVIEDALVTIQGSLSAEPLAMRNSSIGEINAWMLVTAWGRVSGLQTGGGCRFYLTDGSASPIYVTSSFSAPNGLANGVFVTVEGIARVSRTTGRQVEIVSDGKIRVW